MKYEAPVITTALSLVVRLGAYCPKVKMAGSDEAIADAAAAAKRRKRPLIGRGNYGKNLLAHFDAKGVNWSAKKRGIR